MLPSVRMLERIELTTSSSNLAGVHPGRIAGAGGALHEGVADIVGERPPAGVAARERPLAPVALDEAAQQEGASHSSGVGDLGCAGAHYLVDQAELGLGDDGGERLFHPHRVGVVLGVVAPDQLPRFLIDTKNCGTRGRLA